MTNGVGGKDSAVVGVNIRGGTSERGGVCSGTPVGSAMTCAAGVVDADTGNDDEKGFKLVEKAVPFTLAAGEGIWLKGFVPPRWSAGLDRGVVDVKGNCGLSVGTDIGLATNGVVVLTRPRDKFMNGFGALPDVIGCC